MTTASVIGNLTTFIMPLTLGDAAGDVKAVREARSMGGAAGSSGQRDERRGSQPAMV
jgi:hypothetical protein